MEKSVLPFYIQYKKKSHIICRSDIRSSFSLGIRLNLFPILDPAQSLTSLTCLFRHEVVVSVGTVVGTYSNHLYELMIFNQRHLVVFASLTSSCSVFLTSVSAFQIYPNIKQSKGSTTITTNSLGCWSTSHLFESKRMDDSDNIKFIRKSLPKKLIVGLV